MRMIFAVFGLLLLITGGALLLIPKEEPRAQTRSINAQQVVSLAVQTRNLAEQVNAPLSILFGLVSLYYSRKRYIVERDKTDGKSQA
jgi:hypothetical protein